MLVVAIDADSYGVAVFPLTFSRWRGVRLGVRIGSLRMRVHRCSWLWRVSIGMGAARKVCWKREVCGKRCRSEGVVGYAGVGDGAEDA